MPNRFCGAIALVAAIALPFQAVAEDSVARTSSTLSTALVIVPFSVVYLSTTAVVGGSVAAIDATRRWSVAAVRPRGDKTALELHSDDGRLKLETAIDTRIAQAEQIRVGDAIEIDTVGKTGYAMKKGAKTIALLAEPGAGAVHSKARS